ncbi:MAG: aminotransferase class I/II-fold pyridoxal phosphate-dependent enzyme, partial [Chthoniobacterales bacterium]
LARQITPGTKLIVLANLHNPSSAFIDDDQMRRIGELAAAVGATVFVDEVYLETLFDRRWRSAFFLGENFVVTSSLTKAYGLSGLRCGWIAACPKLARRMWDIVDMTYGIPAHTAEQLSVLAFEHLPQIAERARALLERNRLLLNQFLASHEKHLACDPSLVGTTVAPRLRHGSAADFCRRLRTEFETAVVPGDFFEAPACFRIGIGGLTVPLEEGLAQVSAALEHNARSIRTQNAPGSARL